MKSVIEVRRLRKVYKSQFLRREVVGLDGLNMTVYDNEVFGFLGPNGAGKSTTLKILTGIIAASDGEASLLGAPAGSVESRKKIGFMPEFPTFHDFLRAGEFLAFYGTLSGMSGAGLDKRIDEVLELVGLPEVRSLPLRGFSKGMMQRIGIAQAVLHNPEMVILDEPMSGLDPVGRRDVRTLIENLKLSGKTVLFSSHVLPDVEMLADRVTVLRKGRSVLEGRLEELLGSDTVEVVVSGDSPGDQWHQGARGYVLRVDRGEDLDRLLGELSVSGRSVVEVRPERRRLEDLFFTLEGSP
jgi:ABC-2 type transport system ATP-binding protein